ncbi:glutamine amidotransferase [Sporomusaceae bacterium BoRhaA]|uniref:imidazole glycerol phosphate synthase subunit HisH n=1 Tax=Pelorhabdus rhamnosifermentans TaxID=2772457 RepID=UPI001C060F10|nr:imidazole glycerol phosphate synthase subunit HisH [Pelorhabdus rhamnosifermentans]MBU2702636.1 glutamine amidotransferase [Pelorhabdus rhamnosifermentans]
MIAIMDYGMGNLYSVEKAFVKLGAAVTVTRDGDVIRKADQVVLPGVGAFGDCMENIRSFGLEAVIQEVVQSGKPFLGICLGLQLMFEGSEETPGVAGLGIFSGMNRKIVAPGLKVPHMGWNDLAFRKSSSLFKDLSAPYVYFVHSYHAVPTDDTLITAVTDYGSPITASVGQGNIQAVQFHPEKSGQAGLKILENFKEMA